MTSERRSPPGGANSGSRRHAAQSSAETSASARPSQCAVVELDQPLVDLDGETVRGGDRGRGVVRPLQRAAEDPRDRRRREPSPERRGLVPAERAERRVDAALQPAAAVQLGLPVPHERDHSLSSAVAPRSSTGRSARAHAGVPRRAARTASTSTTRPRDRAALRRRRPATPRTAARRDVPRRTRATRTPPCAPTPRSARAPQNQPIASSSARRRRSRRPRPVVTSIVDHEHDASPRAACARRPARRTAGRAASAAARPRAIRRKSRPGLWNTFQTPKIAPNTNHSSIQCIVDVGPSSAGVHERVGVRRSRRAERAAGRRRRSRRAVRAASSRSGRRCGCLTFHVPFTCSMTSFESARTRTRRAPNGAAASSPAISARYSATLFVVTPMHSLTSARHRGGSVDGIEHHRTDRRRTGVPARAAVAIDQRLRRAAFAAGAPSNNEGCVTARGSRSSCRSTRRRSPPRGGSARLRSTGS